MVDILCAVAKALPEIFPSLTASDAKKLFWKSQENCYAIIFVTHSKVIHISYKFPDIVSYTDRSLRYLLNDEFRVQLEVGRLTF